VTLAQGRPAQAAPMEVHIDLAAGGERPTAELQDTFVSIRVGKERRQGRFTGARKVSFSAAAGQERSCRVDVFRHMGSGYVKLSGGDSEVADVEVPMGSPSLPRVRWRLSVRRNAQAATPIERQQRTQQRRDAAHEYWTKHHLDTELVDIIRHLLRERPENPRAFLSSSIRKGALAASALDCGEGGIAEDDLTSGQEDGPVSPQRAPAPGFAAEPCQEVRTDEPLLGAAAEPGVEPVHTATGSAGARMVESISSVPPEDIQALASAPEEPQKARPQRPGTPVVDTAVEPQMVLAAGSDLCSPARSPEPVEETLSTEAPARAEPPETALHRPGAPVADAALEPQLGLVTESELCSPAQSPEPAEETLSTKAPAPEGPQEAGEPRPGTPVVDTAVEPQLGLATEREFCSAARSPEPLEEALSTEAPAPEGPQEAGEPRPQTPVVDIAFEPQLGLATQREFCSPEQSPEPVEEALSTEATAPERPQEARPPRPETPVVHAAPEPQLGLVSENGHCSPAWSPEPVEESEFTAYYRGHVLDLSLAWVPGLYEQFQATAPGGPPEVGPSRPGPPVGDVAAERHLGLVESERCSPARSMEPAEDIASTEGLASTVPGSKECCHVSEVVNEVLKAPLRPGSDGGVEVRSSVSAPGNPQEQAKEQQHVAPKQNCEKTMEEGLTAATEETLAKHQPMKGASSPTNSLEALGAPRRPRFPSTITAGSSIGPAESVWTVLVDSSAEASPSLSSREDEVGGRASHGSPLQRTQSDEYTIECFFLTELEPSEPSARAGDTTVGVADSVDASAQWLTQKVLRGRQEVPLEVNMVDVEMRGSRTVSRSSRKTVSPSPPGTPWIIKGLRPSEREETRRSVPGVPEVEKTGSDGSDSWRPSMPAASKASRASSSTAPVGPLPSNASNAVRLRVTIERAMNLRNADWLSLSDPYCILDVSGDEPKKFQTKVIEDNLHPVWEESYDFDYICPLPLEFRLFDKDFGKTDDFLGKATLTHDMFWPDGFDGYVLLEDARKTDGKDAVLFLKVHRIPSPT